MSLVKLREVYSYNGYSHIYYTKGTAIFYSDISSFEKYHGVLKDGGGVLNGTYAKWEDKSGINYTPEDLEHYISLIEQNKSFFDFMNEYADIYWSNYHKTTSPVSTEKTKPSPGMNKTEVQATDWGYPDKKNVDTYSWGTKEQWVYDDYGYVYFEDGIVTSVSER